MKRLGLLRVAQKSLFCFVPLVLLPVRLRAAEPPPAMPARKTVSVTTNVLSPFFGAYYLAANLRASSKLGVMLNSSYFSIDHGDWHTRTGTLGAGLSYYFEGEALSRFYLEAFSELMLSRWRYQPSGNTAPVEAGFSLGSVVGHRWLWQAGPVLDLAAGALVMHFPSAQADTSAGRISSEALTRVYPAVKVDVGWAF
jgi:hypothetical protein